MFHFSKKCSYFNLQKNDTAFKICPICKNENETVEQQSGRENILDFRLGIHNVYYIAWMW